MSSRFVPAGTDQVSPSSNDDWAKAKSEVENKRNSKPVEPGKQEGGKSLYETLQANKASQAAKQEAFEEAAKLRNQFRALDDSEVEFLDSVRESERAKETITRQETAEQLDLFRSKQQSAAELIDAHLGDTTADGLQKNSKDSWTTSKKRRRDKGEDLPGTKLLKSSSESGELEKAVSSTPAKEPALKDLSKRKAEASTATFAVQQSPKDDTKPAGLGLGAYDSEDD